MCRPIISCNTTWELCNNIIHLHIPQRFHMFLFWGHCINAGGFLFQCTLFQNHWHRGLPIQGDWHVSKGRACGAVQSSHGVQAIFSRVNSLGSRLGGVRTFLFVFPCRQIHSWLFFWGCNGWQYCLEKGRGAFSCTLTNQVGFQGTYSQCQLRQIGHPGCWWHCSTWSLTIACRRCMWSVRKGTW